MRTEFIGAEGIVLLDTVRRLYRRQAKAALGKALSKIHPGELAWIFRHLTTKERRDIFQVVHKFENIGDIISEFDQSIQVELLTPLDPQTLSVVITGMPTDDQADLLDELPDELRDQVLEKMKKEDAAEVEDLLQYDADSAGGIMSPDFLAVTGNMKVSEAIDKVQRLSEEAEMAFYLYVVDDAQKLQGVVSLRQLLMNAPAKQLSAIMETDVVAVSMETDQEQVAQIVSRYNILAVPVIDHEGVMLGIVTVDDVLDIIREEATEDFFQMVGAGKDREILLKSTTQNALARLPWLLASWIGGVLAMSVISSFQTELSKVIILAGFIPVITGMGGNIGTQSSAITIRGLATGRININETWRFISKQLQVGLILGALFGFLLGVLTWFVYDTAVLGLVVALAISASMMMATMLGTLVPIVLRRLGVDPAIATGPFVTTITDVLGVAIYFLLAKNLMAL